MLDVKRPAVERIKLDHGYSSVEQIYNMLQHWKQRNANKATFKALLKEMKDCNSVTIDWEELREKLGFGIEALMDPEPMEVEALNPPAPTYALRGGAGGTRAMQPRSLESGVEESEPMDTSLPIAAQNLPGQNVPDAQMANDGQFGAQPQNESRFGDTRAIQPHNEEKLASRILHFGIVPLLAYHDALLTDQSVRFGHDVLHMDIKSLNIVLDLNNNARLIDFGLAREMKEPNAKLLMTASPVDGTVGYFPTTTFQGLTKFHDYHNFGV
ncbi:Y1677-like protein, partial [Mya arenaria]